jgi:Mg2+-importing ATPase
LRTRARLSQGFFAINKYVRIIKSTILPKEQPTLDISAFWTQPLTEIFKEFTSSPKGLSAHDVWLKERTFGLNVLETEAQRIPIIEFLKHFNSPIIILLMIVALLSLFVGETKSAIIILTILLLSVIINYIQEHRANRAAEKLKKSVAFRVKVLRDGKKESIPATKLVPGDVIFLEPGNLVPADCILLEARDLFVNQSILTGETYPAEKSATVDSPPKSLELSNARNAIFMGSSVVGGNATALIVHTGKDTFLGGISKELNIQPPISEFTHGVSRFGYFLIRITFFLVIFVLISNLYLQRPWLESVLYSLALAVGIMPEFLPIQISIALARGAVLLSKKKVIVKRLAAIHDLGSMDILCTDKTGTLTQSRVNIERTVNSKGKESKKVGLYAYLNSFFQSGNNTPLDQAILSNSHYSTIEYAKLDEIPFNFDTRYACVLLKKDKDQILIIKGAPESIIQLCKYYEEDGKILPLTPALTTQDLNLFQNLSKEGLRTLAVAEAKSTSSHLGSSLNHNVTCIFLGFITFYDPPKEGATQSIKDLLNLGVKIKVITGDNENVALHLCHQLGLNVTGTLTGEQMMQMNHMALMHQIEKTNVFARVSPSQKNQIIVLLKRKGHVVGFIGDGVNDAPSIHTSDVGISVENAVDVAKEAADFILLHRDLSVISQGIYEGRRTYANLMKYIMMLTSSNLGNMMSMSMATFLLPFIPMAPPQLLLSNLLYDVSQIPIPLDNVEKQAVEAPHKWNIKFIQRFMLVFGTVTSIFDLITFYLMLHIFKANKELFQTGWFIESLAATVLVIFIVRTRFSPLKNRPNPLLAITSLSMVLLGTLIPYSYLGPYFNFAIPSLSFIIVIFCIVITFLILVEIIKRWYFAKLSLPLKNEYKR